MKRYWNPIVFGGLAGSMLVSWIAPKAIAWYFDPPVNIGVNCREATVWSMQNLQRAQFVGLLVGAAIAVVIVFVRSKANKVSTEQKI